MAENNWGEKTLLTGVITPLITGDRAHLVGILWLESRPFKWMLSHSREKDVCNSIFGLGTTARNGRCSWLFGMLINGGGPNYLLTGMILQVTVIYLLVIQHHFWQQTKKTLAKKKQQNKNKHTPTKNRSDPPSCKKKKKHHLKAPLLIWRQCLGHVVNHAVPRGHFFLWFFTVKSQTPEKTTAS